MLENIICLNFKDNILMINLETLKNMFVSKSSLPLIKRIVNNRNISESNNPFLIEFEKFIKPTDIYKVGKIDPLINPTLVLTYDCNYSCIYCYEKNDKRIKSKFTIDYIDKIDEFYNKYCSYYGIDKEYGTISLTGGETLLPQNRDIMEKIIKYWRGNSFYIFTNGTFIEHYKDLLIGKDITLQISLDGIKDIHYKKRITNDPSSFDKTIEAIKWALDNNITVRLLTLFYPENLLYYSSFFDLLESIGWLDNEKLSISFNLESKSGSYDFDYDYLNESITAFINLVKMDPRALKVNRSDFVPGLSKFMSAVSQYNEQKTYSLHYCAALCSNAFAFLPTGAVSFCALSTDSACQIGTFYPNVEINYNKKNDLLKRNILNMEDCRLCKYKFACRGGCPITSLIKKNKLDDPNCMFWKNEDILKRFSEIIQLSDVNKT